MASQDVEMWIGEDISIDVTLVDESGNVINLKDCDLIWKASAPSSLTTETIEKDTTAGITITSEVGGTVQITIDHEDTLNMIPLGYDHELRLIKATGDESVVLTGTLLLKKSITAQ